MIGRLNSLRPLLRYTLLGVVMLTLFFTWRYSLYSWFETVIKEKQAAICQLEQQLGEQLVTAYRYETLCYQLPSLRNVCSHGIACAIGTNCCEQSSYIFQEAQKAGLYILNYHTEKEKKKNQWQSSQSITLSYKGSLTQLESFLAAIGRSERLVQCTLLSLCQGADKICTGKCVVQFIVYKI